jgi:lipopolysaccharide export system permease protein
MFNDLIVPPANRSGYVTLQKALGRSIDSEKGENIIYPRYGKLVGSSRAGDKERLVHLFYARDYFNGAMVDVTLLDFSRPNSRQMLTAKLARYDQKSGNWEFINGNVINISENGGMNTTAEFDSYFYPLGQGPLDLAELPRDANNMTVAQAREGLRILDQAGDRKEARKLRVRIQEKFSFPAICLVFGLIGASLGSRPNGRTSRSQGFGISVLLIFLYYLLAFVFSSLGVKGTLTPFLSAWSPVFIGLLGGAFLLREASQ